MTGTMGLTRCPARQERCATADFDIGPPHALAAADAQLKRTIPEMVRHVNEPKQPPLSRRPHRWHAPSRCYPKARRIASKASVATTDARLGSVTSRYASSVVIMPASWTASKVGQSRDTSSSSLRRMASPSKW